MPMPAQVLIMAAGLGSRLKDLTTAKPKALIEACHRPLIDYALAFAKACGAERRIVVGGFCHADVATRVGKVAPDAIIVENKGYRFGNLLSMLSGKDELAPGGFLLMNTDHIYNPPIAKIVAGVIASATEITAFTDTDRKLGADDMKVKLDANRHVAAMAKPLTDYDVGYVGMTFVPASRRDDYFAAAGKVVTSKGGLDKHVESILVELANAGRPPAIADISGHGWLEIDEPHEREHAEKVLERERWWAGDLG
jgi:1L-myo-inositol 1-phosphate cytidylyltransferase